MTAAATVARIKADIETVPEIGLVHGFDIWERDDIQPRIVSNIAGVDTLRAWWVTGPAMEAEWHTNRGDGHLERTWTYRVHGMHGTDVDGSGVDALRDLGLQVTDALDRDDTFGDTVFRKPAPASWAQPPGLALFADSIWAAYMVIAVPVVTLTVP